MVLPLLFFFNGPFPASFSLFSSFQYSDVSKQMFFINKFLPMTGFEPRTLVSEATALPTEPQPLPIYHYCYQRQYFIRRNRSSYLLL